jgi:PIN domain nuclease of toxin-antitoxin system
MDVVTDTHSIVWYFTNDPMLSKKALDAFEKTTKEGLIIIPAVVLAEMMFIAKKGKIVLNFEEILKTIEEYDNIEVAPLDIDILKVANKIEKELEMHDRLIVATALYYNAPLITKDRLITQSQLCPTLW